MANKVIIVLDSIPEFHEPKPYAHYASVRVEGFRGEKPTLANRFYHRCEDIRGIDPVTTEQEALALADAWIGEPDNCDKIIQEIIAAIGE